MRRDDDGTDLGHEVFEAVSRALFTNASSPRPMTSSITMMSGCVLVSVANASRTTMPDQPPVEPQTGG